MRLRNIRFTILLMACLTIMSCDSKEEGSEITPNKEHITIEKNEGEVAERQAETPLEDNQLKIIGDKVNIRNVAYTYSSKVIGQLKKGDIFNIKTMSDDLESIGQKTDFWYEIEKDGKSCWVFGAFTSKKLSENPQTTRCVYKGTEQGDYFYILFEKKDKDWLDFGEGYGLNNFGSYKIVEDEKKYKGKTFDVTWKVILKETYAGEGIMETVERECPVILNLELVE